MHRELSPAPGARLAVAVQLHGLPHRVAHRGLAQCFAENNALIDALIEVAHGAGARVCGRGPTALLLCGPAADRSGEGAFALAGDLLALGRAWRTEREAAILGLGLGFGPALEGHDPPALFGVEVERAQALVGHLNRGGEWLASVEPTGRFARPPAGFGVFAARADRCAAAGFDVGGLSDPRDRRPAAAATQARRRKARRGRGGGRRGPEG